MWNLTMEKEHVEACGFSKTDDQNNFLVFDPEDPKLEERFCKAHRAEKGYVFVHIQLLDMQTKWSPCGYSTGHGTQLQTMPTKCLT